LELEYLVAELDNDLSGAYVQNTFFVLIHGREDIR
jgi:hypothetical protein